MTPEPRLGREERKLYSALNALAENERRGRLTYLGSGIHNVTTAEARMLVAGKFATRVEGPFGKAVDATPRAHRALRGLEEKLGIAGKSQRRDLSSALRRDA